MKHQIFISETILKIIKIQFIVTTLLCLSGFSLSAQTITVHNQPPPLTLICSGGDVNQQVFQDWYDDYTDPANGNVTSTCSASTELYWTLDNTVLFPFSECSDFEVMITVGDQCTVAEFIFITATINFEDDTPPIYVGGMDPVTNAICGTTEADVNFWLFEVASTLGYQDDCSQQISVTYDCPDCGNFTCGSTATATVEVTDACNNSANYVFTLNAILNNDDDGDGIVNSVDNCISIVNPGQEDIDLDGIGNACDTENSIGQLTEIESNLYLSAPYTGLVLKSENGSCYVVIVNNNGSLSTLPVTCP